MTALFSFSSPARVLPDLGKHCCQDVGICEYLFSRKVMKRYKVPIAISVYIQHVCYTLCITHCIFIYMLYIKI